MQRCLHTATTRAAGLSSRAWSVQVRSRMSFCPRSSVRSERHRAKVEVAGASPAVDAILPLCLSSHRTGFVNSYSSVRVRPEAPIHGDHDVTAASRPVTAVVPVRIRLVTPISMDRNEVARVTAIMRSWFAHSEPCQDARRQAGRAEAVASACSGLPAAGPKQPKPRTEAFHEN